MPLRSAILNCHRYRLVVLLTALLLALPAGATPDTSGTADKSKVYFAGVAYLGSNEFIDENYSHARRLNKFGTEPGRLNRELSESLQARPPQYLDVRLELADQRKAENIVFVLAIDREYVSRERYRFQGRPHTKIIAEVSAQALFFNVDSQSLVANFPLARAINHVIEGSDVADQQIIALFDRLYLGGTGETGFIAAAAEQIRAFKLKDNFGFRFQMTAVSVDPSIGALLPPSLSMAKLQQAIGQFFSAQLSARYPIRVLPYVRGYTIGQHIPGRFANGQAFNLEIPNPDFVFRVAIERAFKFEDEGKLLYGAQTRFTFAENGLDSPIAEDNFRYAVYKLQGDSEGTLDDWGAYEDAVENLLTELVQQLGAPNRAWITKHARNRQTYDQLQAKKRLFHVISQ
jgi:hypothetical protein